MNFRCPHAQTCVCSPPLFYTFSLSGFTRNHPLMKSTGLIRGDSSLGQQPSSGQHAHFAITASGPGPMGPPAPGGLARTGSIKRKAPAPIQVGLWSLMAALCTTGLRQVKVVTKLSAHGVLGWSQARGHTLHSLLLVRVLCAPVLLLTTQHDYL